LQRRQIALDGSGPDTMNETAVRLAGHDVGTLGLDDLLALLGIPSRRRTVADAPSSAVEILRGVASFLDKIFSTVTSVKTVDDFVAAREQAFLPYMKTLTTVSKLVRVVVPTQVIEQISNESFAELEADIRDHGLDRFGTEVKDQAFFTVWTLRRTSSLLAKMASAPPLAEDFREQDQEIARNFVVAGVWAQFHLDCLLFALRQDRLIQIDVLPEIIEGLRAAVSAYGYAREGLELRNPVQEPAIPSFQWDEEDQFLMNSSMREMEKQLSADDLSWDTKEAAELNRRVIMEQRRTESASAPSNPAFGKHIREGIEIIKDWIENPNPQQ
jgi:hypothetical protein